MALNIPAAFPIELMYIILVSLEKFSTSNTIPTGQPDLMSISVSQYSAGRKRTPVIPILGYLGLMMFSQASSPSTRNRFIMLQPVSCKSKYPMYFLNSSCSMSCCQAFSRWGSFSVMKFLFSSSWMKSSQISSRHQSHIRYLDMRRYCAIRSFLFVANGIAAKSLFRYSCHVGFANFMFASSTPLSTTDRREFMIAAMSASMLLNAAQFGLFTVKSR